MTEQIQNFVNSLVGTLGNNLPSVLVTLAILVVGFLIAKLVKIAVKKVLNKLKLNQYVNGEKGSVDLELSISSIVYYVILLNVLLIVLERMGITSVLEPLKKLALDFFAAVPNIIGAGIVFYVGWVIAKLVSGLVEAAAGRLDALLEKKNIKDVKIAKFVGAFVFGSILLPVIVSGLQFLNIEAITVPAVNMIEELMAAVPNIIGAALIVLVSYIVGRFVVYMLLGLLQGMNIDSLPAKLGSESLLPSGVSFSKFVGHVIMFFVMLSAFTAAVERLQIDIISNIFGRLIEFGGGLLLGGVILLIGNFLAQKAYTVIKADGNVALANIARFAVLGLVLAMGLKAMGLADNIVYMAFGLTLSAVAVAVAIAFGIGGREAAKSLTQKWVERLK
jgi:hypothetical protein